MSERNSDPPLKTSEQTQMDANIPRRRVSMGTETDLWNLDDELPAVSLTPTNEPTDLDEESIVRVEKNTINRGKSKKVAKSKVTSEIAPQRKKKTRSELEQESPSTAPTPVTEFKAPPKGVGLLEDEIWSDFDLDDEPTPALEPKPAPAPEPAPITAAVEESPALVLKADTYRTEPLELPEPEIHEAAAEPAAVSAAVEDTPETPQEVQPVEEPTAPAPSIQITKFSRVEVIASLIFLALLLGSGIYGVHLFRSNVQAQSDPFATPDYPVKGAIATVQDASTYWREPIRTGPNADVTKRDVTLIPVIDIALDEKKSASGVLRVMFYDDKGEITGDIITREFRNHRFIQSGSPSQSFASTAGFSDFGEEQAYRASLNDPWTIKVYEGPSAEAPSSSFLLLFSTPISTKRK